MKIEKISYQEKLKAPRWQKKRLEVFERDKWQCVECNDAENTLNVHHYFYEKGKEPWEYELNNLATLCNSCHENERFCRMENERELLEEVKRSRFLNNSIEDITRFIFYIGKTEDPFLTLLALTSLFEENQGLLSKIITSYKENTKININNL